MINYEATEPCVWHAKFCATKREVIMCMCMHTCICAWLYVCVFMFAYVHVTHRGTCPVGGEGWLAGGWSENSKERVSEAFWSVISKSILIPKTWVTVQNLSWSFESCATLKARYTQWMSQGIIIHINREGITQDDILWCFPELQTRFSFFIRSSWRNAHVLQAARIIMSSLDFQSHRNTSHFLIFPPH